MNAVEKKGGEYKINIFPKQKDFIDSDVDEILYGGAAGGGKSHALLLFALKRRLEYPDSNGIIFRRTYPELERSLILKSREIYGLFGGKFNDTKKRWKFLNGSTQQFGHCEGESDVYKYQGDEYQDMCFDELTHFSEFQFKYLTSRLRTSNKNMPVLIRNTTNPGNLGHAWVYKRYIEPSLTHRIWKDLNTGKRISFISAKIKDNPALSEADPDYIRRLKELPEKKYLALAHGRWDVFEGAFFPEFDPRHGHGVTAKMHVPSKYTRKIICLDWGFSEPACALWLEITPSGRVFAYRELYVTRRSPKELAKDILDLSPKDEEYDYIAASPEIWGKKVETEGGGQPIQELMEGVLKNRMVMQRANNARIPGWLKVREFLFKARDGMPWLQISPNCVNLIRTFPSLIHDEKRSEDINNKGEDHALEALRYGLVSIGTLPKESFSPYESSYHKIFGTKKKSEFTDRSYIPGGTVRGGYGI